MHKLLKQTIEDGLPHVVEGLLAQNPGWANERDRDGSTPLTLAVSTENRSVGCIRALIEAGADVNATHGSFTVLHWAVGDLAYLGNPSSASAHEVVSLLVEAGAQLEAVNQYGFTPLTDAIIETGLDNVRALLAVGANPNAIVPSEGGTAFNQGQSLLSLSWFNHDGPAVIEALLEAGADLNLRDHYGRTALEYFQGIEIERYQKFAQYDYFAQKRLQSIELLQQA